MMFLLRFCASTVVVSLLTKGGRTPDAKRSAASRHVFQIWTHCFLCMYAHRRHHSASVQRRTLANVQRLSNGAQQRLNAVQIPAAPQSAIGIVLY